MPTVTRWMVRAALAWLVLGLVVETGLGVGAASGLAAPRMPTLRVALLHTWVFGFVVQLIFGVAWWLFPKRVCSGRGSEALAGSAGVLLNLGLALRVLSEPFVHLAALRAVYALAALLQFASVLGYATVLWPRVRGPR